MLDVADRKLRILEQANAVCAAKGLALVDDDGLLDEVAGLAEWPTPILGDMDPQFLDLPPEVVRLSMKVHQKYFAVRDPAKDGLAPHFVVVANVEATDGGKALAAGNSRVLSARLNDARFFWDEDRKVGFDAWLEKLKGVTFHAKLGTLAERVDRIAALAREIAPLVGADPDQAEQAARLAKADLASGMVGEFPELQGVMGGYYARADHGDAVADAIRDHYKPQGPGDTVPTAPVTVAVALADKLDTLVGFFAIDEKPTGSKDPFALRRAALGVIRLVLENGVRVNLHHVAVQHAERLLGAEYLQVVDRIESLLDFIQERLAVLLRDQAVRHDIASAAFATVGTTVIFIDQLVARVHALSAFLATDDGANLLAGYKRASKSLLETEEKKGVATRHGPDRPAEPAGGRGGPGLCGRRGRDGGGSGASDRGLRRRHDGAEQTACARGRLLRQGDGELRRGRRAGQPAQAAGSGAPCDGPCGRLRAGDRLARPSPFHPAAHQ